MLDADLHKSARLQILRQLASSGYNTSLVALRSREKPPAERLRTVAVPLRYTPIISPIMFAIVLTLLLPVYILRWRPEFIVFTQPDVCILGSIPTVFMSKLKKVKCVLDIRSTPVETVGLRGFLQHVWFSVSVLIAKNSFDGITIITHEMKSELCERFHIDPAEVGVWTSGVSTTLFNPQRYVRREKELRGKFGLSRKFVVFYHGVFSATRGLTEFVEAMKILKPRHPDIVAFLLGKGPSAQSLRDLVKKENLEGNVIIHDPVDYSKVPEFIAFCDVSISPLPDHRYWRFQGPLKLLEYMAMEKVIILTDIPAHRVAVDEAKCGIYVTSMKPTEIARAIIYAYDNSAKLKDWGMTGRKIVEKRYTWEKVAYDLESYLLSLRRRP
jgi:glycosyltransferase involved in cell wall biosynthesis